MDKINEIYKHVAKKINTIEKISEKGSGKAILAKMRRGIGKEPGELAELWWIIFEELPEELIGKNKASSVEWAIYTSLTLYALHRQGGDKAAHCDGVSLGTATSNLIKSENDIERILNRLNLVVTANSPQDLAYYLKSVIQLLKNENILLDYALLAKHIYLFLISTTSNTIKLDWGRDFYRNLNKRNKEAKEKGVEKND